jgi:hypothetical protein
MSSRAAPAARASHARLDRGSRRFALAAGPPRKMERRAFRSARQRQRRIRWCTTVPLGRTIRLRTKSQSLADPNARHAGPHSRFVLKITRPSGRTTRDRTTRQAASSTSDGAFRLASAGIAAAFGTPPTTAATTNNRAAADPICVCILHLLQLPPLQHQLASRSKVRGPNAASSRASDTGRVGRRDRDVSSKATPAGQGCLAARLRIAGPSRARWKHRRGREGAVARKDGLPCQCAIGCEIIAGPRHQANHSARGRKLP